MARFYGSMRNSRGSEVTAQGNKSGHWGHIRGWAAGVSVDAHPNAEDEDEFVIFMTSGSNGRRSDVHIGTVRSSKDGPVFVPANQPAEVG